MIQLQPEIEAQLTAEAHARGLALDDYLASIVTTLVPEPAYIAARDLDEDQLDHDLQQGLDDIAVGRTRPAREVFAELCEEFGIHG